MRKRQALFPVKILVSAVLLFFLYRRLDLDDCLLRFRGLRVLPMVGFFGLLLFNTAISAAKWRILLSADHTHVPFLKLFTSYFIATFFNVFLPSNIGGDAYRIYDISRHSSKPVNTVASVFADRLSGFIALSLFGFVFPLLGLGLIDERGVLFMPLAVFTVLAALVWLLFQKKLLRAVLNMPPWRRWERLKVAVEKFLGSVDAYRRRSSVMARVMSVSFVFQFAVIIAVYLLGRALELEIPFFFFCMFVPLISLLEAVPVSIYGLGLRDSGYVFFMTQIGRSREDAAAISLLYVAATLVYSAIGGIILLFRRNAEE